MNTSQRIVAFLNENKEQFFCDKCIGLRLSLEKTVLSQQVTQTLEADPSLVRQAGPCSNCARERVVTKAPVGPESA